MSLEYRGEELDLFRHAANWKSYYGSIIAPFLGKKVLEVGAGIGATTQSLCAGNHDDWVCLEPDTGMAKAIDRKIADGDLPSCCRTVCKTLAELDRAEKFDSILYIDVLEHIADDRNEVRLAAERMADDGYLIILSPAHQFLFTPFDKSIGHFRRYNLRTLAAVVPGSLRRMKLIYLDSVGGLASMGNKLMLRQSMPTLAQILFWDRYLVPVSTKVDSLLAHKVGKSILGVWQKVG
jgi:SAM-dependent methyltransferase